MIILLSLLLAAAQPVDTHSEEVEEEDTYLFYGPLWEEPYAVPLLREVPFVPAPEPTMQMATMIEETPCKGFEQEPVDVRIEHVEQESLDILVLLRALKLKVEEEQAFERAAASSAPPEVD